jgi:hypothetical protein
VFSEVFDDKNLVMPTSLDRNEVNMGFMLAYPLLVFILFYSERHIAAQTLLSAPR